jgi:hypothetical protein
LLQLVLGYLRVALELNLLATIINKALIVEAFIVRFEEDWQFIDP